MRWPRKTQYLIRFLVYGESWTEANLRPPENTPQPVRKEIIDPFYEQTEVLAREDIADGVAYMVTRPRHSGIGELWTTPTEQL